MAIYIKNVFDLSSYYPCQIIKTRANPKKTLLVLTSVAVKVTRSGLLDSSETCCDVQAGMGQNKHVDILTVSDQDGQDRNWTKFGVWRIREERTRWFGRVLRWDFGQRMLEMELSEQWNTERHQRRFLDVVMEHIEMIVVSVGEEGHREKWRWMTNCGDLWLEKLKEDDFDSVFYCICMETIN